MQLHMSTEKLQFVCLLCLCVTWEAAAVIGGVSLLDTGASVLAWWGAAWHVGGLTVLAGVLLRASAVVWAHLVYTHATIETWRGSLSALVDVLLAGLTVEGGWAGADVGGIEGWALATVCAWIGSTWVGELARFTLKTKGVINHDGFQWTGGKRRVENKAGDKIWSAYLTTQAGSDSGRQWG